ncbi:hypothetical protein C9374_000118 [Naegleria lovaniensis]|uniref:FHA domain-containing protein n=1 Tax=Naegleria lovaniensis TaxID=51637 RepID=A0AA88GZ69_NAELO|nr:uncharacterized protein C9374_000118 [Naegleria lovaniensis]KAG2388679.1 hypothetical protein C9374_000118 [Naegleria lovaniensis]
MWLLAPSTTSSEAAPLVYVIPNRSYTVGRKRDECEVFVDNDKSISRKHAVFSMEDVNVKQVLIQTQSDPIIRPVLSLTDHSKYGTFVLKNGNYEKIGENNKIEIVDVATIRFGVYESVYSASYQLIVFCVSRIDQKDRKKLANQCKTIDAKYATIWTPHCTHLIVNESDFAITEKLALALLLGIPIVTMSFVDELEKTLTSNSPNIKLPDPDNFAPSSDKSGWKDIGLQSPPDLKQDPKRKIL